MFGGVTGPTLGIPCMTRLCLVRHAETEWSIQERFQGCAHIPLNECGREQARLLALFIKRLLPKTKMIFSSDLQRARETAEIIGSTLGLIPVLTAALREVDFGCWTGYVLHELELSDSEKKAWEEMDPFQKWGGGEAFIDVYQRVIQFLKPVLQQYSGSDLVIVTHGLVIQMLISGWLFGSLKGMSRLEVSSGCLSIVELGPVGDRAKLICLNVSPWLIIQ